MLLWAAGLVPLIGCVGLGVDVSEWVLWKRQLHSAADSAALAGAQALANSQSATVSVNLALQYNTDRAYAVEAVETPPTAGAYAGDTTAVRVILSTSEALPFSSLFIKAAPKIMASATAQGYSTAPDCVIALDPSSTTAITVTGSAALTMNCGMTSNAPGGQSVLADAQTVDVPAISAVGSITAGSGVPGTTKLYPNTGATADPYSGLAIPDLSTMCAGAPSVSVKSLRSQTINPGCYSSLKSLGGLYLNPGTYYIDGGNVTVGSQSLISGSGVTLVFTSTAVPFKGSNVGTFSAAGNSFVQLSAPTSGPYTGVVMYQDRNTVETSGNDMVVTGSTGNGYSSWIQGAVYAPSTTIKFTGNSGIATPCMQLVAKDVIFTGNTSVSNNCPPGPGGPHAFGGGRRIKLVE